MIVRQETPANDNEVRIFECRASVYRGHTVRNDSRASRRLVEQITWRLKFHNNSQYFAISNQLAKQQN